MHASTGSVPWLLCALSTGLGCAAPQAPALVPPTPVAVAPPTAEPAARFSALDTTWPASYGEFVARALEAQAPQLLRPGALPADEVARLCPGLDSATPEQYAAFWNLVLAAIAHPESHHDPQACMRESAFSASKENAPTLRARFSALSATERAQVKGGLRGWLLRCHEPRLPGDVYSEGLLQLSYGDETRHPGCPIDPSLANLRTPEVQLTCAVVILARQLTRRGRVLLDGPMYYWSVLNRGQAAVLGYFDAHVAALPFCRAPPR